MKLGTATAILCLIFLVVTLILCLVTYLRDKTLDQIRGDVYQLFLKAEHNHEFAKSGRYKMKWVLSKARALLPGWAQLFITDDMLEKIVQGWFDSVKDLLDDGKLNGTGKEVK